jgi:hypothetical protein
MVSIRPASDVSGNVSFGVGPVVSPSAIWPLTTVWARFW